MVGSRKNWLLPEDGWPIVPFLHGCQGPGKDNAAHGTPKGQMFKKVHQALPKRNNGIGDWGLRQQLHLGRKRAFNKIARPTFRPEVVKRVVRISIGLQEVSDWALWRSRPPQKRKKIRHKNSPRKRRNGGTPVGCMRQIALRRKQGGL
jgi:hypothetical protein